MTDKNYICVYGAKEHNLKNIDLKIPKNKLVVFTGLSGSGKSSLAFDTLYVEGQRRYVESLSSYARQFLGGLRKSDVERIEGLSPAISIDQKTTNHNPRSTVGTITEIYDYLRLLFAKIGHQHCPTCGQEISTQSVDQIVAQIIDLLIQSSSLQIARIILLSPIIKSQKGEFNDLFRSLKKQGFMRLRIDKEIFLLNDLPVMLKNNLHNIEIVIDRLTISKTQLRDKNELKILKSRLNQSLEESLRLSDGFAILSLVTDNSFDFPEKPTKFQDFLFSEKLACSNCNLSFSEPNPKLFSFNSPEGACPHCHGLGSLLKIDQEKIIAPSLTLSEGAVIPLARNMGNETWWVRLIKKVVSDLGCDFHKTPFKQMNEKSQNVLLFGSKKKYFVEGENRYGENTQIEAQFIGFIAELEKRFGETESDFIRREIGNFMHEEICPLCLGDRLKKESLAVTINHLHISQISQLTIIKVLDFFKKLDETVISPKEIFIAQSIVKEIINRLEFLLSVGLEYLTLSRKANTLAGGEAQRIRLASQIGTGLTGVLYILDEPTIGLHQRDNRRLIKTLKSLRDQGNSVVVVEHDKEVIMSSDYVFDFGPEAGSNGWLVVASGHPTAIMNNKKSLTGQYLSGKKNIKIKKNKLESKNLVSLDYEPKNSFGFEQSLQIFGANWHNLRNIEVEIPLKKLVCITGVSGSGKSTLLYNIIYAHLNKYLGLKIEDKISLGKIDRLIVPDKIKRTILIDQSPIGKTPRSNPATYTSIFTDIRKLMAQTFEAKSRGFNMSRFSFNVKGGRCETCQGDGQIKIEMQFLPDVYMPCDVCGGQRYNEETLQVFYKGKNISQILNFTVNEAFDFFCHQGLLKEKLAILQKVGLGYITLGQSATTLSGGEAQRVKLAKELVNKRRDHNIYLLDEPTTGLHFADVDKLLQVLYSLVNQDNTVVVIEHNLDIIKNADWIIDLGPEGGEKGGQILGCGTPNDIARLAKSYTGFYLKKELNF